MWRSVIAILSLAFLFFAVSMTASAEKRAENPDISVGTCIHSGGADDIDWNDPGPIRTCCIDNDFQDIHGCYICDRNWENCVWDPSYSQKKGKSIDKGKLDETPQPQVQPPK